MINSLMNEAIDNQNKSNNCAYARDTFLIHHSLNKNYHLVIK